MFIFDLFVAFAVACLSGMGIGGGGLLVLYLTGVRGLGQLYAQGCNLLFFVFSSAASLFIHNRKRQLDFRLIGISAALAVAGSQIGVRLTGILPEETVRHMFGWMLIIAGTVTALRLLLRK